MEQSPCPQPPDPGDSGYEQPFKWIESCSAGGLVDGVFKITGAIQRGKCSRKQWGQWRKVIGLNKGLGGTGYLERLHKSGTHQVLQTCGMRWPT